MILTDQEKNPKEKCLDKLTEGCILKQSDLLKRRLAH